MSRNLFSDPHDQIELSKLRTAIEQKNDFIIWLIEESGELDHTNQDELWDKHNKWLDENF